MCVFLSFFRSSSSHSFCTIILCPFNKNGFIRCYKYCNSIITFNVTILLAILLYSETHQASTINLARYIGHCCIVLLFEGFSFRFNSYKDFKSIYIFVCLFIYFHIVYLNGSLLPSCEFQKVEQKVLSTSLRSRGRYIQAYKIWCTHFIFHVYIISFDKWDHYSEFFLHKKTTLTT